MFVAIITLSAPIFRQLDHAPTAINRSLNPIDGLRAFLAFSVFFSHMSIRRNAVVTGIVALPPAQFYSLLGSFGVSVFFMITGYLFWDKLIRSGGHVEWGKLYISRFFRIVPLYWSLMIVYISVVLYRAHFTIAGPLEKFVADCCRWLAFGMWMSPLPLLEQVQSMPIVGMTWTLSYEWLFYFSLPILALFARTRYNLVFVCLSLAILLATSFGLNELYRSFILLFLLGMLSASLLYSYPFLKGDSVLKSITCFFLLTCVFLFYKSAYGLFPITLLGGVFFLVASGTSIFGLLHLTGCQRLGNISYSVYLLHGVILSVFLAPSGLGGIVATKPLYFWLDGIAMTAALIALASVSFLLVEQPGIILGKRISTSLIPIFKKNSRFGFADFDLKKRSTN